MDEQTCGCFIVVWVDDDGCEVLMNVHPADVEGGRKVGEGLYDLRGFGFDDILGFDTPDRCLDPRGEGLAEGLWCIGARFVQSGGSDALDNIDQMIELDERSPAPAWRRLCGAELAAMSLGKVTLEWSTWLLSSVEAVRG